MLMMLPLFVSCGKKNDTQKNTGNNDTVEKNTDSGKTNPGKDTTPFVNPKEFTSFKESLETFKKKDVSYVSLALDVTNQRDASSKASTSHYERHLDNVNMALSDYDKYNQAMTVKYLDGKYYIAISYGSTVEIIDDIAFLNFVDTLFTPGFFNIIDKADTLLTINQFFELYFKDQISNMNIAVKEYTFTSTSDADHDALYNYNLKFSNPLDANDDISFGFTMGFKDGYLKTYNTDFTRKAMENGTETFDKNARVNCSYTYPSDGSSFVFNIGNTEGATNSSTYFPIYTNGQKVGEYHGAINE